MGGPQEWRGQRWRAGSGRFANRGGRYREYYAAKYGGKGTGKGKGTEGKGRGAEVSVICKWI